uniref:PIF1/LRR1 pleckstrin homology domain-containing protein n=1 Tax=Romanomermis culicivorax TaxID=13658 RepID=A0A915HS81_ROMCU
MHLKCDCLILNSRQQSMMKKKPSRCILTYGTVKKKAFLRIINQSQKDLLTCPLENNVEKFFDKFLRDGKLTVRFKEPSLEVLIS